MTVVTDGFKYTLFVSAVTKIFPAEVIDLALTLPANTSTKTGWPTPRFVTVETRGLVVLKVILLPEVATAIPLPDKRVLVVKRPWAFEMISCWPPPNCERLVLLVITIFEVVLVTTIPLPC